MSEKIDAINLWELEARARELLPKMAHDYYASGANDEITLRGRKYSFVRRRGAMAITSGWHRSPRS